MNESKTSLTKKLKENPLEMIKCALLGAVVLLLLVNVIVESITAGAIGRTKEDLADQLTSVNTKLSGIYYIVDDADVLKLGAIKLRGSKTWTLPVASAAWSGR